MTRVHVCQPAGLSSEAAQTYYQRGFFNVTVAYDNFVRVDGGPVRLVLHDGPEIIGQVYRTANGNGTARVFGNAALRDWFQEHYTQGDVVPVTFESERRFRLGG